MMAKFEITHRLASRDHPQSDGLAERMVETLKQGLRRCLLDQAWDLEWDDLLPYVAMGYRMSKQKWVGYSPYFLLYGREPIFPTHLQDFQTDTIDPQHDTPENLSLQLAHRGAILREVMPMAMRNLAIAQQRDQNRFRNVRGGGWAKPKATFVVGDFVMLQQPKGTHWTHWSQTTCFAHFWTTCKWCCSVTREWWSNGCPSNFKIGSLSISGIGYPNLSWNICPDWPSSLSNMRFQEECKSYASVWCLQQRISHFLHSSATTTSSSRRLAMWYVRDIVSS